MTFLIRSGATSPVLFSYPPLLKQPSAVTVNYRTPDKGLDTTWTSATVDTVSTTVSATAAVGATTLSVTSATGVTAGSRYLIGDDALVIEVRAVSGTTVTLTEPLPRALASAETFLGYRVSHALTTADVVTRGPGLAVWRGTIASVVYEWEQTFVVARQHVHAYTLTAPVLTANFPVMLEMRPTHDDSLNELISAAWTTIVERDLRALGLRVERVRSWAELEDWHAVACVLHAIRMDPRFTSEFRDRWQQEYEAAKSAALSSKRFWYDEEDELADQPLDPVRLLRKVIRR